MFDLVKNGDIWTLSYRESQFNKVLFISMLLAAAVLAFAVQQASQPFGGTGVVVLVLWGFVYFGLLIYRMLNDSDSITEFHLTRRCLTVDCKRPWFGAPRSFDFADVAALETNRRSGDDPDDWEVRIKLRDGKRILLGVAKAGRRKQAQGYIEEIRDATGIAARDAKDWWSWE